MRVARRASSCSRRGGSASAGRWSSRRSTLLWVSRSSRPGRPCRSSRARSSCFEGTSRRFARDSHTLVVTQDSWPSVEPPAPSGLPRVEDLPVVERGFDQERVREAFDSFYRHLARLDSTLRALEAVDVFKSQATELRKELRARRLGGWTQQPWQPYASARASTRARM